MTKNALSDYTLDELYNEIQSRGNDLVDLGEITLRINPSGGGGVYKTNASYAECQDPFLSRVQEALDPKWVIDVGANIGFTAIQLHKAFKNAKLIAAEPNPYLHPLLEENLRRNGCTDYRVYQAAIGAKSGEVIFHLNDAFTSDSRIGELDSQHTNLSVAQLTLDSIQSELDIQGPFFLKIDTQGYEQNVLLGASNLLNHSDPNLIKMEFAPFLLETTNTDPQDFLLELTRNYCVAELRLSRFHGDSLTEILQREIKPSDVVTFLAYTRSLSRSSQGWTDLVMAPRTLMSSL